eukprot:SAG31_NODE_11884_length_989_cov_0.705618_2_plen_101_part_01
MADIVLITSANINRRSQWGAGFERSSIRLPHSPSEFEIVGREIRIVGCEKQIFAVPQPARLWQGLDFENICNVGEMRDAQSACMRAGCSSCCTRTKSGPLD